jgi:hypothetical protein
MGESGRSCPPEFERMASRDHPHRNLRRWAVAGICLLVPLAVASAQSSGGTYTLRKHVIASGGAATAPTHRVVATAGQPVAVFAQGGTYKATMGFHGPGGPPFGDAIFCHGFESTSCP